MNKITKQETYVTSTLLWLCKLSQGILDYIRPNAQEK
jgi:hypothetical protein